MTSPQRRPARGHSATGWSTGWASARCASPSNPDRAIAIQVLRRAVELGVNHIDTAAFYYSPGGILGVGRGPTRHATELIREALAPYPDDLVITTKVGPEVDPVTGYAEATTTRGATSTGRGEPPPARPRPPRCGEPSDRAAPGPGFGGGTVRRPGPAPGRRTHPRTSASPMSASTTSTRPRRSPCRLRAEQLLDRPQPPPTTVILRACGEQGIAFVPFFAIRERQAGGGRDAPDGRRGRTSRSPPAHGASPAQVRLAWTLHQGPHVLAIPGTGDPATSRRTSPPAHCGSRRRN